MARKNRGGGKGQSLSCSENILPDVGLSFWWYPSGGALTMLRLDHRLGAWGKERKLTKGCLTSNFFQLFMRQRMEIWRVCVWPCPRYTRAYQKCSVSHLGGRGNKLFSRTKGWQGLLNLCCFPVLQGQVKANTINTVPPFYPHCQHPTQVPFTVACDDLCL